MKESLKGAVIRNSRLIQIGSGIVFLVILGASITILLVSFFDNGSNRHDVSTKLTGDEFAAELDADGIDVRTRNLPDNLTCGDPLISFGESAQSLCDIPINSVTDKSPIGSPEFGGLGFPALTQITQDAGTTLSLGSGRKIGVHEEVTVQVLQYVWTATDLSNLQQPQNGQNGGMQSGQVSGGGTTVPKANSEPAWQLMSNSWKDSQYLLKFPANLTNDGGTINSNLGFILNGQKVGAIFAAKLSLGKTASGTDYPPMLMIGTVVDSKRPVTTDDDDDSSNSASGNLPKPTIATVSNAPKITIDSSGKSTAIDIPSEFKAPEILTVTVLEQGSGQLVRNSDVVRANWAGYTDSGEVIDSTFSSYGEAGDLELTDTLPALAGAIAGQKVGSKLMIFIPATLNGSEDDSETSYVYFVDIVGVK